MAWEDLIQGRLSWKLIPIICLTMICRQQDKYCDLAIYSLLIVEGQPILPLEFES